MPSGWGFADDGPWKLLGSPSWDRMGHPAQQASVLTTRQPSVLTTRQPGDLVVGAFSQVVSVRNLLRSYYKSISTLVSKTYIKA